MHQGRKIKKFDFSKNYSFSCYQQTSPLDVPMYAIGYPKAKALAQFVNSKAFFLSPSKSKGCLKNQLTF